MAVKNHKSNNLKLGIQHHTLAGGREMNLSVGCRVEKFREKSVGKAREKKFKLIFCFFG